MLARKRLASSPQAGQRDPESGVHRPWTEWLAKFEQLLSGIDGVTATVHLRTELVGDHTCEWLRPNNAPGDWPPVWEFQGGMRSF